MKRKRRLAASRVQKRTIRIGGRNSSIGLEDAFWLPLKAIAAREGIPVAALVDRIDADRDHANLSSTLRLFVLDHYRRLAKAKSSAKN